MKGLPIGIQHLDQIIRQGWVYVDKTQLLHKLIKEGSFYFLSRPRRFGKSLVLDTLKEIFMGNQDLFKDLWIYDKIEWKEYPVVHLDFSLLDYRTQSLEDALTEELETIAESHGLSLRKKGSKGKFNELITKLRQKEEVIVLIDEYDKPITDYITNLERANENRETLRNFFGILKPLGNKLRFTFITGIAKFSKVSLFTVLNNLDDLTLQESYATLTGITEEELTTYFAEHLQKIANKTQQSIEELLRKMRKMYDGYSWDGKSFVYNPFSVLKFLKEGIFDNYWFATGTPTFLVEILRNQKVEGRNVTNQEVDNSFFNKFDIRYGIDVYPLLFQTGYTTIKKIRSEDTHRYYTLNYPNEEVERSFVQNLIEVYTFKTPTTVNTATIKLEKALKKRDIEVFEEQLNVLLSDISYRLFPFEKKNKDKTRERLKQEFMAWEGYFQTVVYLVLQYIGVNIQCEITKHKGWLDAVIEVENYVYIMEYKLEDAQAALKQIKEQKYAHSYRNTPKEVVLMGVTFDRAKKEIKPIEWEVWDKTL